MNYTQNPKYILCELSINHGKVDLTAIADFTTEDKAAAQVNELRADNPTARFVVLTEVNPIVVDSRFS